MKVQDPWNQTHNQGMDFKGHLTTDMCKLMDIEKTRTTPRPHPKQGLVFQATETTIHAQPSTMSQLRTTFK